VIHAPGPAPGVYAAKLRFQPSRDFRNRPPACASAHIHTRASLSSRVPFSSLFRRVATSPRRCDPGPISSFSLLEILADLGRTGSINRSNASLTRSAEIEIGLDISLADSSNPRRARARSQFCFSRENRTRSSVIARVLERPIHVRVINSGRRSKAIPWGRELSPRFKYHCARDEARHFRNGASTRRPKRTVFIT